MKLTSIWLFLLQWRFSTRYNSDSVVTTKSSTDLQPSAMDWRAYFSIWMQKNSLQNKTKMYIFLCLDVEELSTKNSKIYLFLHQDVEKFSTKENKNIFLSLSECRKFSTKENKNIFIPPSECKRILFKKETKMYLFLHLQKENKI